MIKRLSKGVLACLLLMLAYFISSVAVAQDSDLAASEPHIAELTISGAIGPATTDYLIRTSEEAREKGAQLFIVRMDTPGGLDAATRDIIQHILGSDIPYITYVTPAGARAASAGTYILYASHIAAMTPSTTLGAATPVQIGGMPGQQPPPGNSPADNSPADQPSTEKPQSEQNGEPGDGKKDGEDSAAPAPKTTMERKVINDSVAYIRGLAKRHHRNADWAEKAVREAATLTASEALEQNVIDIVADNRESLLQQVAGREVVLVSGSEKIAEATATLPVVEYSPDWRNELLSIITNPQVAYILLLIGIYGLIFEGYSPGAMVPGIVGVICLLLGLYALQVLPINYAGLALIVVGALLIAAEFFVPSFGALGIGGVVALVIGSVMLIDSDVPGMQVSRGLIGSIAAVSGLGLLGLLYAVGHSLRKPKIASDKALIGRTAVVMDVTPELLVKIDGEIWRSSCDTALSEGQVVRVIAEEGLQLKVEPD
ncbi:nodulation protein NfeD [uncultured Microbulbifer sp.]|uniref:NfeD family protein n=1 Tax=uncultured Microbulbifer sp. TaxID=348147 RepID=UPI0025EE0A05|nr:nodulation protein NfeD [uncultured Microbulbifer sp.]